MRSSPAQAASRGAPSVVSSVLGSCCLLLALVDRSTAFVAHGGVGIAGPGSLTKRCVGGGGGGGAVASLAGRTATAAAAVLSVVPGAEQEQRRRTQLAMAIDTTNNPITSKVYGRADNKGASKTPDMNEEIAASGVSDFTRSPSLCSVVELFVASHERVLERDSPRGGVRRRLLATATFLAAVCLTSPC